MNGIQATGENSFYFTNSGYFKHDLLARMVMLLALPLTDVVFYDGDSYTVVDSGLVAANGIVLSPDGQYLYVCEAIGQRIQVYRRDQKTKFTRVQTYDWMSGSFPDNLEMDERTGNLYVAAHPIGHRLLAHMGDIGGINTPSQVVQLQLQNGLITSALELFYDDGELVSGSSSALVYNNTLLVSSIFRETITCDVNVPLL